jgi:predicted Zn-dependent protease
MSLFKVDAVQMNMEQELGDMFRKILYDAEEEIEDDFVVNALDSLVSELCNANDIERSRIKLHVVDRKEVNAFALPDGHLVIYSSLILAAESEEELCGVIGHEMAHITLHHVMKRLIKEVGLSVLISMTSGGGGTEAVGETARMLSSSAFDRWWEREADLKSVDYLVSANINPEPFADFLYRLSEEESELMNHLSWVSTHPDSKERAIYIVEHAKERVTDAKRVLLQETWDQLKTALEE